MLQIISTVRRPYEIVLTQRTLRGETIEISTPKGLCTVHKDSRSSIPYVSVAESQFAREEARYLAAHAARTFGTQVCELFFHGDDPERVDADEGK